MGTERKEIIVLFIKTSNVLYWNIFSDLLNGGILLIIHGANYWRPEKLYEMESGLKSRKSRLSASTDMLAAIK